MINLLFSFIKLCYLNKSCHLFALIPYGYKTSTRVTPETGPSNETVPFFRLKIHTQHFPATFCLHISGSIKFNLNQRPCLR
ncbi:hypothetical protein QVD17_15481 [Tagetes erecta]|uniref:Uncharacterized protein n=1 Tax=Tagetes erecta TaxID=13708 RepID=A0AAD8KTF2_TARER|nr:hypothetical protein QVD17_15481 [Tagetes erecta]